MSIASTDISSGPYTTNGATTSFPVTFPFLANDEITVYRTETVSGALSILVLNSDYTVTGAGNENGGAVIISPALASGYTIYIVRNVPLTQTVDIANQSTYFPNVLEGGMDRLEMQIQMLAEKLGRAYLVLPGEPAPDLNALLTALVPFTTEYVPKTMFGVAQAGSGKIFGKHVAANECYVEAVILEAFGGPPVGQDLICKLKIDGVVQNTNFALGSGQLHAVAVPATPTTVHVPQGSAVELYFSQVGTVYPGMNVTATLQIRKRFSL